MTSNWWNFSGVRQEWGARWVKCCKTGGSSEFWVVGSAELWGLRYQREQAGRLEISGRKLDV